MENSEGEAGTDTENQESKFQEVEVPQDSLVPVSGPLAADTDNGQPDTQTGTPNGNPDNNGPKLTVVGEISMDYSRVSSGYIVLLSNGQPMMTLNLQFLFGSMTRNARK